MFSRAEKVRITANSLLESVSPDSYNIPTPFNPEDAA